MQHICVCIKASNVRIRRPKSMNTVPDEWTSDPQTAPMDHR